ncbi:MAG: DUF2281 domain-containing protein [Candidatus Thiodiazotropha sp. (ex Rostrolucina anterorostrata)]|nr:DUF2281 domain-containing protein [Candidatus Thiodiazotropha sp. (ex Rostrolucina anterorostrata)]
MTLPAHNVRTLLEKIRSLPTERIAEVEDFVDFLRERTRLRNKTTDRKAQDFPVDDLGPWPEGLSLRREDMYGDDGR